MLPKVAHAPPISRLVGLSVGEHRTLSCSLTQGGAVGMRTRLPENSLRASKSSYPTRHKSLSLIFTVKLTGRYTARLSTLVLISECLSTPNPGPLCSLIPYVSTDQLRV